MEKLDAMTQPTEGAFQLEKLWQRAALVWGLVVLGLSLIFWPTVSKMVDIWWTSSTFNHCFLILPIVGYLVWERRAVFSHLRPQTSFLGLGLILLGSLGWLLGDMADAQVVQQFAFVLMLQGSVLAVCGKVVTRQLVFPLFFLFFAVPFGEFLVPGLQNITAHITIWLLKATGLPVFSDGVFISVPNGDFHVAEACSGVRFLIAAVPLGLLFANVSFISWRRRAIVVLLSFLIPIIANGIRAYGIIMIAYFTNNQYALGVDHLIYGWIFFAFVILVFLSIGMFFVDRPHNAPIVDTAQLPLQKGAPQEFFLVGLFGVLALVAANIGPVYGRWVDRAGASGEVVALTAPAISGNWRMAESGNREKPWSPVFKGASSELLQDYIRGDGVKVTLYMGYYSQQNREADILGFGNTVAAPAPWEWASGSQTSARRGGTRIPVNAITIVGNYERRSVWYWYWVDNQYTANPIIAKLLIAKSKLLSRRSEAAVIAVSMGDMTLNGKKKLVLEDFLAHVQPVKPFFVR